MLCILRACRPQAYLAVPDFAPASLKTIINRFFIACSPLRVHHPSRSYFNQKKHTLWCVFLFLVEVRGVEPLSENAFTKLSPSAVYVLHSLTIQYTNKL